MREPLLCVSVTAATMEALRRARDAAAVRADLVEVRLDGVHAPDARGAIEGRTRPVIVTCRPQWEGGRFDGSEEERHRLLAEAVASGAEFVDVEARAECLPALLRMRRGRGIVASMHVFGPPAADIASRAVAMRSLGAEVVKVAIEAHHLTDMLVLFALGRDPEFAGREGHEGHLLVAMGDAGVASRVLAARLGSRWTYAGEGIAPGQLPPSRLLNEFRFRRIKPDAAIYGVTGNPVMHSLSPVMHNAGFAAQGLNATYVPLQATSADDFVDFANAIGLRGASVTAPFKVDMLSRVDDLDGLAQRVGAVNTIAVRDGRWIGSNTDIAGFLCPLRGRIALKGTRVAVLGAGGAARAVAVALAGEGAAVTICARNEAAAREVAALCGAGVSPIPPRRRSWDVLVNATTCGSAAVPVDPMEGEPLDGEMVFDLVYAPPETPLLTHARASGCLTIGGLEMLVGQAERQFEMWTGQRPPAGLFMAAATAAQQSIDSQSGIAERRPLVSEHKGRRTEGS